MAMFLAPKPTSDTVTQALGKMVSAFMRTTSKLLYFNVGKWKEADKYGKLKNLDFDNFRSGERVDSDEYEREQVSDFVLWKAKKEGEPSWEFEFASKPLDGRPGWHLECSVMEKEILGLPFDIHTGGIDL